MSEGRGDGKGEMVLFPDFLSTDVVAQWSASTAK